MHEAAIHPQERARRGAHYTPDALVAELVDPVLDALLAEHPPEDLRIVDPACGAGAFLLHAHRRLTDALSEAGHAHPEAAALDGVIGIDRDLWATRLCRLALALRAGVPLEAADVRHQDALLHLDDAELHAHAVIGNPPFLGGKRFATVLGADTAETLRQRWGVSGNVDLAALFLLLGRRLLRPGGHLAFVLTDTIAQGETRRQGLARVLDEGLVLVRAVRSRPWAGSAHVHVSLVHGVLELPGARPRDSASLDGRPVRWISSYLRADRLDHVPEPLGDARPRAFIGCDLKGMGFVFGEPGGHPVEVLDALRADDPHLDEVVRPYVSGHTLTRVPGQHPRRLVADLTGLGLDEARARHPGLLALLDAHVRPDRASRSPQVARARWWRFWRSRPALRQAIAPLQRCLVAPVVARHLVWSWQPTDRVFNHKVLVVATDDDFMLGALQCALHLHWARALSSTLGRGMNYTPTRCYPTYPLPPRDPAIADAARHLDRVRREATVELDLGDGRLQQLIEDAPADLPSPARAVRDARAALDQAVLSAWGWTELEPSDADAVLHRLMEAGDALRRG